MQGSYERKHESQQRNLWQPTNSDQLALNRYRPANTHQHRDHPLLCRQSRSVQEEPALVLGVRESMLQSDAVANMEFCVEKSERTLAKLFDAFVGAECV